MPGGARADGGPVAGGLRPPLVDPAGPVVDDAAVVRGFARGEPTGHSSRFHAEGPALLLDGDITAALRLSPGAVLVRRDFPDGLEAARTAVERALEVEQLELLDTNTLFGVAVSVQLVGDRVSGWDLWGDDMDAAFAALRRAAAGDVLPT